MDVKKLISDFSIAEKIELYNCLYTDLSKKGIGGDTELAHVNSEEIAVLRAMGGAGTINPNTNLIQFFGGGGSSSPPPAPAVSTQVSQSEFPTELKPFIEDIFGKSKAIQEQRQEEGFQAFQGPLQAEFDPAQTRAFERIEQIPGATQPLFDEATTLAREATRAPTDPQEVASFMNPFLRNVTDIQKREAQRVADVEKQQLAAQAAQTGAFGGSRAAILEAERKRNLATQLDDIEARGLAASFQDAQARLANQRAREGSGAAQLAALGSAIPAQQLKELGALSGVGAARQTQAQRGIDLARQEFEAEEAFPLQTLQEFSSILRGFPIAPTRTTSTREFSAAQPLSTQLLGVGTQALGALGAAGIKPFGQAGGMVREMPVKAQSGGALSSLMEKTRDLDTSPVLGMKSGGDIMSILSPGVGALKSFKKGGLKSLGSFLSPIYAVSRGKLPLGLSSLLGGGGGGPDAPPPPPPSPTISQEELDKQIDAALRQRAAQGQQMASRGAGPAQVGTQVGQVRQPFKGGGGLRQMVQLPSNRVRFGKDAYQDVSFSEEEVETLTSPYVRDPQASPFMNFLGGMKYDIGQDMDRARALNKRKMQVSPLAQAYEFFTGTDESLAEVQDQAAKLGEASVYLQKRAKQARGDDEDAATTEGASELDTAPSPKAPDTPDPDKKKKGEDLYRSPEEAAYASLMETGAERGQKAAERYFGGENVGLANISEALKAYKGFKDTEMAQRRLIDKANREKVIATAKARRARLEDQLTMANIEDKLGANDRAALSALTKLLDNPAVYDDPDKQLQIEQQIQFYINKARGSSLADLAERGGARYGASPKDMAQRIQELEAARQLAAAAAAKKSEG